MNVRNLDITGPCHHLKTRARIRAQHEHIKNITTHPALTGEGGWVEQCNATHEIKLRYGVKAAFDYLVAEKLLNFADAATRRPEFARELPRFVAYIRGLFTPQEMRTHLARIEREQTEYAADNDNEEDDEFDDDDELIRESPAAAAERARQFAIVKELLTATELGTS
jgi:hypothetical protein